jgi:CO/xanthine dehydrogenase Mo-binding subunit
LIDGEAIVCDENGLAVFELIRGHGSKTSAVLCAFDLLELDGRDLRRRPIEERKGLLAKLLRDSDSDLSIVLNKHYEKDGAIVFREACRAGPGGLDVPLTAATLAGLPQQPVPFPGNIHQDSAIPYKFANVKTVCRRLETTPFRPSWIRTPGRMQNTYANESFIDELAVAAGMDPLDFRLKYLDPSDKRGIEVLQRLAQLSNWRKRPSLQKSASGNVVKGRGMSYVKYELVRTYVGVVAEVEVDRSSGEIRVPKFYVVHDCGQIINPDGLKNQIEGCVVQTVSRTLIAELKFNRSQVTSLDWESYPILKFPQIPEIVIDLIDRPTEKPWGAGEPSASVIPSAITNAMFDATGVRLRSIPYTPAKVKAAMQAS